MRVRMVRAGQEEQEEPEELPAGTANEPVTSRRIATAPVELREAEKEEEPPAKEVRAKAAKVARVQKLGIGKDNGRAGGLAAKERRKEPHRRAHFRESASSVEHDDTGQASAGRS